ncbi:hypothetical protein RE6C_01983 [Rhodopirellula europaea 6C]|uniref:Uncharacterized protein n=1 Tax=Rhodopirellula europaea 6C TaxID=1263867 RepID=M2AJY5_9BACT|nr:hypothetical protein RE6C_01983 [Rhodopirellula europaea 6C]
MPENGAGTSNGLHKNGRKGRGGKRHCEAPSAQMKPRRPAVQSKSFARPRIIHRSAFAPVSTRQTEQTAIGSSPRV